MKSRCPEQGWLARIGACLSAPPVMKHRAFVTADRPCDLGRAQSLIDQPRDLAGAPSLLARRPERDQDLLAAIEATEFSHDGKPDRP